MTGIDRKGRSTWAPKHVRHYEWMLASAAYRSLSCHARCLLIELGRRHSGDNNGDIPMSVREAADLLGAAINTARGAFSQLEDKGFIRLSAKGTFRLKSRHSTTWELTEWPRDGKLATKDFMRWEPAA